MTERLETHPHIHLPSHPRPTNAPTTTTTSTFGCFFPPLPAGRNHRQRESVSQPFGCPTDREVLGAGVKLRRISVSYLPGGAGSLHCLHLCVPWIFLSESPPPPPPPPPPTHSSWSTAWFRNAPVQRGGKLP